MTSHNYPNYTDKKLRITIVKQLVQGHTARKWEKLGSNLSTQVPKCGHLPLHCSFTQHAAYSRAMPLHRKIRK